MVRIWAYTLTSFREKVLRPDCWQGRRARTQPKFWYDANDSAGRHRRDGQSWWRSWAPRETFVQTSWKGLLSQETGCRLRSHCLAFCWKYYRPKQLRYQTSVRGQFWAWKGSPDPDTEETTAIWAVALPAKRDELWLEGTDALSSAMQACHDRSQEVLC